MNGERIIVMTYHLGKDEIEYVTVSTDRVPQGVHLFENKAEAEAWLGTDYLVEPRWFRQLAWPGEDSK